MMIYAGIGSRNTPKQVLRQMIQVGQVLGNMGFVLRSGAADGADAAFEAGANSVGGATEIFLPWYKFAGHDSPLCKPSDKSFDYARTCHPAYKKLNSKAQHLIARNMHQILGADLCTPVDLVICWTKDQCESHKQYSIETGGTGSAISCASRNRIPVFNLAIPGRLGEALEFCVTRSSFSFTKKDYSDVNI